MIIQIAPGLSDKKKDVIINKAVSGHFKVREVRTQSATYLIAIGTEAADIRQFGALEGVMDVHHVADNYKLVSRKWKRQTSAVRVGNTLIGAGDCTLMAGPCSIENEQQVEAVVAHLVTHNIKIMRGGVFKPRSSPYTFRGLGLEGLKMFYDICRKNDISIITEVMESGQIDMMYDYVDIFQVGARNSQNFNLLDALGEVDKPVLLKRGISGTIDELLQSAEYIFSGGNEQLLLCERGIRTYENAYRNTFDINAIPLLREKTHLPVIADPSHGTGMRSLVPFVALAAAVAGADGIMYEVHPQPEKAFSDGQQTLNFKESTLLIGQLKKVLSVSR